MATNENFIQVIEDDISSIVTRFGKWVSGEFNEAAKVYNALSAAEKQAANYAYGVIAIVNQNLNEDAAIIIPLIQKAYPSLSLSVLQGFIDTVLNDIKAVDNNVPLTLEEAVGALATYLKGFTGTTWGAISQTLGNLISVLFSPETAIQKFVSVAEIVYQLIVKPKVATA